MKTYQLNTKDPRVLKKIKHVLGYSCGVFSEHTEQQKSRQALENQFGNLNHPLSKYLFNTLLICTDTYYNELTKTSKKYILNINGVSKLRSILKNNIDVAFDSHEIKLLPPDPTDRQFDELVVNAFILREYKDELETLNFNYEDKSNRYWHSLQNIRSEYRHKALSQHGLKYNYDICACAPTLLMQHAQQQNGVCFIEIEKFLKDRTAYRQHIADECNIELREAKIIINSLFCGAKLGLNNRFALSKVLDHDAERILCAKEITSDLRIDIKDMWDEITPTMPRKRNEDGRLIPIQSKNKWGRYFDLERQVVSSVREYLKTTDNKYFLEHDGWVCEKEINQEELIAYVKSNTKFDISIDFNICDTRSDNITDLLTGDATIVSLQSLRDASFIPADTIVMSSTNKEYFNRNINVNTASFPSTTHLHYRIKISIPFVSDNKFYTLLAQKIYKSYINFT
jgi:hypothetical protein